MDFGINSIKHNINGKLFQVIYNMYQNIRSCVKHSGEQSESFYSNIGLRQGENLSPVLFVIIFEWFRRIYGTKVLSGNYTTAMYTRVCFLHEILVLLYADDTAVIADNPVDFQTNLDHFIHTARNGNLMLTTLKQK